MNIFKKTKSVTLILDSFNEKEALSTIELVDKFANKMNKTTVYRILERLEEASILHSFVDQNGLKRYAKNNKNLNSFNTDSNHSHFLCEDCGISLCVPIEMNLPKISNFTVKNSEHLLMGHCNNCTK